MLIPNGKVEGVVSDEVTRFSLTEIRYDVEGKRVIASDGKMAVVVPVEPEEGDATGMVNPDVFRRARKIAGKRGTPRVTLNGNATFTNGETCPRSSLEPETRFPDIDAVTQSAIEAGEKPSAVCLDAELLITLAKAVGNGDDCRIELWFNGDDAMLVKPYVNRGVNSYGVLMPIKTKPSYGRK